MKRLLSYIGPTVLLLAAMLALPAPANSAFFGYVDKAGRRVFVDDKNKIPLQFRESTTVYNEPKDRLSDTERARLEAADAEKRQKARQNYLDYVKKLNNRRAAEAARRTEAQRQSRQRAMETPVIISNNQILVPVVLGHQGIEVETHLLLDTGASIITLNRNVANQLKVDPAMRSRAKVVGGASIRAGFMELSYVRVGPIRVNHPVAGIIDHTGAPMDFGGFLGMNILKNANFKIDFDRKVIRWLPEPTD